LPYACNSQYMTQTLTIGEAAATFLASLPPQEREKAQQEVYRFARWFGFNRQFDAIRPTEIGRYGEQISSSSSDPATSLEPVKSFLNYSRKTGLTATNYSTHLRVRKTAHSRASAREKLASKTANQPISMTAEGYAALQAELLSLEEKRPKVVDEIQKAAADKDFRENAPLQAAKEQQGYLEGRIRELEATLKAARVVSEENGDRIGPGDYVVLNEINCEDELCVTVVHATEANPGKGKISLASPIGKALIGRSPGDTVEVAAPGGVIRYKIAAVERKGASSA